MTVTGTRTTYYHVLDGVVVLLLDLVTIVEKIVTEGVKTGEVYTQIGHLKEVLHLLRVWIVDGNIVWQNSEMLILLIKILS